MKALLSIKKFSCFQILKGEFAQTLLIGNGAQIIENHFVKAKFLALWTSKKR